MEPLSRSLIKKKNKKKNTKCFQTPLSKQKQKKKKKGRDGGWQIWKKKRPKGVGNKRI